MQAEMLLGHDPEVPEWYERLKASKELGVPPWVLDGHPYNCTDLPTLEFWAKVALIAQRAENEANSFIMDNPRLFPRKSELPEPGRPGSAQYDAARQHGDWLRS